MQAGMDDQETQREHPEDPMQQAPTCKAPKAKRGQRFRNDKVNAKRLRTSRL
jgi:hypothetical protein